MRSESPTDATDAENQDQIGRDSGPNIPNGSLCASCRNEEPEPAFTEWNEKPIRFGCLLEIAHESKRKRTR